MFMSLIGLRLRGLPLKGTSTPIILLPVTWAVVGRSWGGLNASCWLGATFDVRVLELKAGGPDILAVGEIVYML